MILMIEKKNLAEITEPSLQKMFNKNLPLMRKRKLGNQMTSESDSSKTNNFIQGKNKMSNITKEAVMDLREKTGAGLIDCKRALAETNGDLEEAISILRKRCRLCCQKSRSGSRGGYNLKCRY